MAVALAEGVEAGAGLRQSGKRFVGFLAEVGDQVLTLITSLLHRSYETCRLCWRRENSLRARRLQQVFAWSIAVLSVCSGHRRGP